MENESERELFLPNSNIAAPKHKSCFQVSMRFLFMIFFIIPLILIATPEPESHAIFTTACHRRCDEFLLQYKSYKLFHPDKDNFYVLYDDECKSEVIASPVPSIHVRDIEKNLPQKEYAYLTQKGVAHLQKCSMLRYFSHYIFTNFQSALWVDSDALFVNELREINFDEVMFGLVSESYYGGWYVAHQVKYPGEFGVNTGVMWLNLNRMKQKKFVEKFEKNGHACKRPRCGNLGDQDMLNEFLYDYPGEWRELDFGMNFRSAFGRKFCEKRENVTIVHLNGGFAYPEIIEKLAPFTKKKLEKFRDDIACGIMPK